MKVLVINAGSSSLKYQLIDMENEAVLAKGNCERIGVDGLITHKTSDGRTVSHNTPFPTHKEAFMEVVSILTEGEGKVIDSVKEISAVGHRVLHGSEVYKTSTLVTDKVIEDIFSFSELGPLHNPPQATAMKACQEVFGKETPMVAIFDTSFHQTMPAKAYMFGIPYEYYEKYSIRRYGFHGTSHRFVSARFGQINGTNEGTRVITCHLGNGSSIAAVQGGKCLDTTMGTTPLEGIIMGTRCGSIDPAIVPLLMKKEGLTPDEVDAVMNKKSGILGVTGFTSDNRDVEAGSKEGNERCQLVEDMLCHQLTKYVGAYAAAMGGVDAIVFTGGIGENNTSYRERVASKLGFMGVEMDKEANSIAKLGKEMDVATASSKVRVLIVPTNEELMIAKDTYELCK